MTNENEVSYQEVFKNRNYMYLWLGQLISQLGDAISLTIAFILEAIPWIIIGPLAGVWVDKMNKKYIIISTDFIRVFLVLILFFTENIYVIFLICFLTQSSAAIFAPARSAMIPEIVQKNIYVKAISLSHMGFQTIQVIGPLLAAAIIGLVGLHTSFILDSITFLISVIISLFIKYNYNSDVSTNDKKTPF